MTSTSSIRRAGVASTVISAALAIFDMVTSTSYSATTVGLAIGSGIGLGLGLSGTIYARELSLMADDLRELVGRDPSL